MKSIFLIISTVVLAEEYNYYDEYGAPAIDIKAAGETAGVDRIGRIIGRYTNWIEKYGQPYKKTPKLVRTVERMRKYFTWWIKGNKRGCKPDGVDRLELQFLDGEIDRTLPDNAMLKVYTYQTQMKRIQARVSSVAISNLFRDRKKAI